MDHIYHLYSHTLVQFMFHLYHQADGLYWYRLVWSAPWLEACALYHYILPTTRYIHGIYQYKADHIGLDYTIYHSITARSTADCNNEMQIDILQLPIYIHTGTI